LNSSVKLLRGRLCRFPVSMSDTVSALRSVSTKPDQAHAPERDRKDDERDQGEVPERPAVRHHAQREVNADDAENDRERLERLEDEPHPWTIADFGAWRTAARLHTETKPPKTTERLRRRSGTREVRPRCPSARPQPSPTISNRRRHARRTSMIPCTRGETAQDASGGERGVARGVAHSLFPAPRRG